MRKRTGLLILALLAACLLLAGCDPRAALREELEGEWVLSITWDSTDIGGWSWTVGSDYTFVDENEYSGTWDYSGGEIVFTEDSSPDGDGDVLYKYVGALSEDGMTLSGTVYNVRTEVREGSFVATKL